MYKKITALLLILIIAMTLFVSGCGEKEETKEIYFLNFKPEQATTYKSIAYDYEQETGIKVKVVTAAANTYEQTLKSEIAKSSAPTIFQINGPVGYEAWKDYCLDLKDSKLYSFLSDTSLAIKSGDGVYGIPFVVEAYGIIYNDAIMKKYFALDTKKVSITSAEQITSFELLKTVVEDMSANKDKLGISGVFASTSLSNGEDWRWQTHLANVPFYYEFKDNKEYTDPVIAGGNTNEIQFSYNANYKNIFDLYLNNSITPPTLLGGKSTTDSMAEFALGKVAMVQNGTWAWSQIGEVEGNTVVDEDIKFLPIYTGASGEESQGLCVGTENYFAINSKVSEDSQKLSLDFLEWLFGSDKGKEYVTNDLKFLTPFNTFTEEESPDDPLARQVAEWMAKGDVSSVPWVFTVFPSENFKTTFGSALLEYAQGTKKWEDVVQTVIKSWKDER